MTLPVAALVAALGAVILAGAHDLATVLTATVVLSVGRCRRQNRPAD